MQLATPSYKLKKEKREAKKLESTPSKDSDTLVDPPSVSVIGAVSDQGASKSPAMAAPEKKSKKEKPSTSKSTRSAGTKIDTDSKIQELVQKWSERFNRLEALLLARSMEPTFSSNVKVTTTHSPPAGVIQSSEPFIKPTQPESSTQFPGSGSSALQHQLTSQTQTSVPTSPSMLPGTGSSASQHQPTSKVQSHRPTSSEHSSQDILSSKQHSTSKLKSHRPHSDRPKVSGTDPLAPKCHSTGKLQTDRPLNSDVTNTDSPMLHRSRKDGFSSVSSEPESQVSDQPPLDIYVEEGELSDD